MSRQNYYARRRQRQRRGVDGDWVAELVQEERQLQPRLGTRKLQVLLKEELAQAGVKLGRDRMFEELRTRDLLVKRRRGDYRSEEHTSELQSQSNIVCRVVVEKKKRV